MLTPCFSPNPLVAPGNLNLKPTIIIECSTLLRGVTGIGRWIELIVRSLAEDGWPFIKIDRTAFGVSAGLLPEYYYYNVLLPRWLKSRPPDGALFLVPDNISKFLRPPCPDTVYFVHDLIPLLPTIGHTGIRRLIYTYKLRLLKKAKGILTTSAAVKHELLSLKWLAGKKIEPVGGFVGDLLLAEGGGTPPKLELPKKFILAVGTGEPRKNLSALLDAYALDKGARLPDLVLYGGSWKGIGWSAIEGEAAQKGISHRIYHAKIVRDDELAWLYDAASAFVFLSTAEGFGLPPLEALARRTPVIVSELPVFREILGEFAQYVAPDDPAAVARAILGAMDAKADAGREFVEKEYSAGRAAERFLRSLNELTRR